MQSYFGPLPGSETLTLLDDAHVGQGEVARSFDISAPLSHISIRSTSLSPATQDQTVIPLQNVQLYNDDDLFMCGRCKQQFVDLHVFLHHKKEGCITMHHSPQEQSLPHATLADLSNNRYQPDSRNAFHGPAVLIGPNQGHHALATNPTQGASDAMQSSAGLNLTQNSQRDRSLISNPIRDAARNSGINMHPPDNGQQTQGVDVNEVSNFVQIQSNATLLPGSLTLPGKASENVILADDILANTTTAQPDFNTEPQLQRYQAGEGNHHQLSTLGVLSNVSVASLLQQIPAQAPIQEQPSTQQQVYIHIQPQPPAEQQKMYTIQPKDSTNNYTTGVNLSAAFNVTPLTLAPASVQSVPVTSAVYPTQEDGGRHEQLVQSVPVQSTPQSTPVSALSATNSVTVPVREIVDSSSISTTGKTASKKPSSKQFICQYCSKGFSKTFDLQQHIRSHTGEKPFQCIVCGRAFAQKSNVKKHMETHKVWPRQALDIMPRVVIMPREELANGAEEATDVEVPNGMVAVLAATTKSCPYCDQVLGSYSERKSHMLRHKDKQVYKCVKEGCEHTNADLHDYVDHVKTHEGSMTYRCHHCHKIFDTLHDLGVHQYQAHLNDKSKTTKFSKKYQCKLCPAKFSLPEMLQKHMAMEKHDHECTFCSKKFSCEQYLRNHIESMHSKDPKKYKCSKCGQEVKSMYYLRSHMLIHTNEKPFKCEVCAAAFNRKDKLRRHMAIHDTTKRYKCPFREMLGCKKEFNRPDKLKAHIICHNGIRAHKCSYCPKRYSRKCFKVEHERTHTGEFRCKECAKAFRNRKILDSHHCRPTKKRNATYASVKKNSLPASENLLSRRTKTAPIPADMLNQPDGPMYAIRTGSKRRHLRRNAGKAGLRSRKNLEPPSQDEASTEESEIEVDVESEA